MSNSTGAFMNLLDRFARAAEKKDDVLSYPLYDQVVEQFAQQEKTIETLTTRLAACEAANQSVLSESALLRKALENIAQKAGAETFGNAILLKDIALYAQKVLANG